MPASSNASSIDFVPEELRFPVVTRQNILNCSFSSWSKTYKTLIPKTKIIKPLPQTFVDYLLQDGILLPEDEYMAQNSAGGHISDSEVDDEDEDESTNGESALSDPTESFAELHREIIDIIRELGGSVMPKLNWSAPRDASWISTGNTLRCNTPSDIYLLLKSSSYITHDLTEAFDCCDLNDNENENNNNNNHKTHIADIQPIEYELVLRKWVNMNPSVEFRCFVKDRKLVGISQRDMTFYEFLPSLEPKLSKEILAFFNLNLRDTFVDPDFVFDVYVPSPHNRVWLIDINPFSLKTDSLLFSWDELIAPITIRNSESDIESSQEEDLIDFRVLESEDKINSFSTAQHSENKVPRDVVEAGLTSAGIADLARQWKNMLAKQMDEDSSSDEE